MSLEALVILETAAEAHGLSFEKQHTKTAHVQRETCTPETN